jgi:hypothetical protein
MKERSPVDAGNHSYSSTAAVDNDPQATVDEEVSSQSPRTSETQEPDRSVSSPTCAKKAPLRARGTGPLHRVHCANACAARGSGARGVLLVFASVLTVVRLFASAAVAGSPHFKHCGEFPC